MTPSRLSFQNIYFRLSVMMFFQYLMFAVWWVPLAAYLANMGVSRSLSALVLSSMAFGAVFAPMVGMLADRYFQGRYLLAFLNVGLAIMLVLAALTTNAILLFVCLLLAMLFYMPTWALASSMVLSNAPAELFPRIRVLGTLGWVSSGVFSLIAVHWLKLDFDGTRLPFWVGAVLALVAATTNLSLPASQPLRDQKASWIDKMGFRSLVMFGDRNYAIFIFLFFLSMIPFAMYWSYFSEYLQDSGYQFITITMSTGQLTEILVLLMVPLLIRRLGLRTTMVFGLIALVIRYVALFLAGNTAGLALVLLGAGVHGLIFGFYHMGSQIYTNQKAPAGLQSQAQGLIFFITFAPGLLAGNFICSWIIGLFSSTIGNEVIYQWDRIWGITALMSIGVLLAFLVFFTEKDYRPIALKNQ